METNFSEFAINELVKIKFQRKIFPGGSTYLFQFLRLPEICYQMKCDDNYLLIFKLGEVAVY